MGSLDMGVKFSLLSKRLQVNASVRDIFEQMKGKEINILLIIYNLLTIIMIPVDLT